MKKNNNVFYLPGSLLPLQDPVFNVVKNIERSYQRRESETDFRMDLSWLNEMGGGHRHPGFILVPSDPLLMRATIFKASMEAANMPVALFSQIDRENIALEMISLETGIHLIDLKDGRLRSQDWPSLACAVGRLSHLPVFIETPGDITEACSKAISLAEDFGIKVLFIDDIKSFCTGTDLVDNPEVTDCLRELSRELGIPVFAGL